MNPSLEQKRRPMLSLRSLFNLVVGLLTLLYPFAVYFGMSHLGTRTLAWLLLSMFGLRLLLIGGRSRQALANLLPLLVAVAVICILVLLRGDGVFFLYYPVAINLTMFASFAFTLKRPPTMIERFARLREPQMPEIAIAYCRQVTKVWCGFFVLNTGLSLCTILSGDLRLWMLYNGLVSYLLMGLLFAIEFVWRMAFKRRHAQISETEG